MRKIKKLTAIMVSLIMAVSLYLPVIASAQNINMDAFVSFISDDDLHICCLNDSHKEGNNYEKKAVVIFTLSRNCDCSYLSYNT